MSNYYIININNNTLETMQVSDLNIFGLNGLHFQQNVLMTHHICLNRAGGEKQNAFYTNL